MKAMRRIAMAVLLACVAGQVPGQVMVDPARLPARLRNFETLPDEAQLRCSVTPIKPALNFSFRLQAGYVVRVPMSQYFGPGHRWAVLTRITPEAAANNPVYLLNVLRLPNIPKTNVEVEIGGGYFLGQGRYQVRWMLADETGRVCRKEWKIDAKPRGSDRKVKLAMAPDTVGEFRLRAPLRPRRNVDEAKRNADGARRDVDDAAPFRLTVLLHAAPLSLRRTSLRATDTVMLLGLLSSMLDRLPAKSVRLVVFNLDQHKELFRQDTFAPDTLDQVAQSINNVQLGLVDYRVLQNRRGHVDLLADLINQELQAKEPSDAVVFLGPMARYLDKMPPAALEPAQGAAPRFFYFQYKPFQRAGPNFPDSITFALQRVKGKTLIIHSPGEFAKAIAQVERSTTADRSNDQRP
jgi:hypothetical protein